MSEMLGPYLLGPNDTPENGIYTGDCLGLMASLPDESVNVILTDPPWGVSYRKKGKEYMIGDTINLFPYLVPQFRRILKPDGAVYMFSSTTKLVDVLPTFQTYFKLHSILIWVKPVGIMPHHLTHYKLRYTPILYGSKGLHRLRSYKDDVIFCSTVPGKARIHPTQKPLGVIQHMLENSITAGDVVCDPCLGSGTTLVVAKELACQWLGFEADPNMAGMARERVRNTQMPLFQLPEQKGLAL